jgi:general secretion pathway protein G
MSDTLNRVRLNRKQSGLAGFTLIEMLIVIVVLGVLAAVVVIALGGVTGQSATAACNPDARTVSSAVSAYEASPPSGVAVGTAPSDMNALVPDYLKALPANSNLYAISLSADDAVEVTLGTNAPGAAYADASGAQLYEPDGNTQAFTFASADGTLAGQGICAGT